MEIAGLITGIRAGIQLAIGAIDARDDAKVRAALLEVQEKVVDLMATSFALSEKNAALLAKLGEAQREAAEIKAKLEERGRYVLHELRPGSLCYRGEASPERLEPVHYLCQVCYDSGRRVTLRFEEADHGVDARWVCPVAPGHSINMGGALPRTYGFA